MSKLPNAPLLEVIFEIRWQIQNKEDFADFQYLHGDLYSILKDKYPLRKSLFPPEFPLEAMNGAPVYRFRDGENGYPLIQIGPGILTLNVTDDRYYWEEFRDEIQYLLEAFQNVYSKSKNLKFVPSLTYVDFYKIDFTEKNPIDYINQNFNVKIEQSFINPNTSYNKELNFLFDYKLKNDLLSINFRNGDVGEKKGIILQSKVRGASMSYGFGNLSQWIDEAHETLSSMFKRITNEELYKTFKN